MPPVLWLSIFSVLPLLVGTDSDKPRPPSLGIFMDFDRAPGDESVRAMEGEVNQLLQRSGVSVDWRLARENRGAEPYRGLVVLKFKGMCRAGSRSEIGATSGDAEMLAATRVDHGHVMPYSEVECD